MVGESSQVLAAKPARRSRARLAELNPCGILVAAVVLVVPLAIDPFGLRAFLPVKQAVLFFGTSLVALLAVAGFAWTAWRAPMPPDRSAPSEWPVSGTPGGRPANAAHAPSRPGPWLIGVALALWLWSLAVTPSALNGALHLGFGWACLSAHLAIFFMALLYARQARNVGSRQNLELLLGAVAIATVLMACHACLQATGADPLPWIVGRPIHESGRWRVFTTTGNPDWTAEYLAAAAPIAVWWFSRITRGAALLWLLFVLAILPTGSRLGLGALLVGGAIYAWANRRRRHRSGIPPRWMRVSLVGLIALGSFAFVLRSDGYAAAVLRWNDFHSVFARLQLWQASLHLVAAQPLHGYGLDHFALVRPDGLRAVAAPLGPIARSRMPDLLTAHAHNDFLERAVETGIPGALLLLVLFLLGLHAAWRALNPMRSSAGMESPDDPQVPGHAPASTAAPALAASLGALLILAMASAPLHTPATALLFWLVLGCLAGSTPGTIPGLSCNMRAHHRHSQRIGGIAATCVVLAATVWAGNCAVVLLNENRQVAVAASMALSGQARAAERLYATALARAPWDHESGVALASLLIDDRRPTIALDLLDGADAWSRSRESWLARAHALLLRHDTGAALQVMEQATAAVPDFLRAEMLQARLAASMGQTSEAKDAWRQVLLSPQRSARAQRIMLEAAGALAGQTRQEP
jgi:O-antigen ligase